MNIKFIYNLESELDIVQETYHFKDKFTKFGYKVYLPSGYNLESDNFDNLKNQVAKELKSYLVNTVRQDILNNWTKHQDEIIKLISSLKVKLPYSINVVLTKYGVGGSYWAPDKVFINVHYKKYFENFIHELIHCAIEAPIIKKHQLDHRSKEGVLDWLFLNSPILKKIFPDYIQQQVSVLPSKELLDNTGLKFLKQSTKS